MQTTKIVVLHFFLPSSFILLTFSRILHRRKHGIAAEESAPEKSFGNSATNVSPATIYLNYHPSLLKGIENGKEGKVLKESPNIATALENVFIHLGKNGATFLGIEQRRT